MKKTMIYYWIDLFKNGEVSIFDKQKEGKKRVVNPENMEKVKKEIMDNRRITLKELKFKLNIKKTSISKICKELSNFLYLIL
jgi:ribosomal protein S25